LDTAELIPLYLELLKYRFYDDGFFLLDAIHLHGKH